MKPNIRKKINELTNADLAECQVWEFAMDEESVEGQDETTVRPLLDTKQVSDLYGQIMVKASFKAADGTIFEGLITATDDKDISGSHPVIIYKNQHITFWQGAMTPDPKELQRAYKALKKTKEQLFPISYQSLIPVKKGQNTGKILGFYYVTDFDVLDDIKFDILQ